MRYYCIPTAKYNYTTSILLFWEDVSLIDQRPFLSSSVAEVSAEDEVSCVMSSSHTVSTSHWEAEVEDGDMDADEGFELPKLAENASNLSKQFSSELKKKFQVGHTYTHTYNDRHLNRKEKSSSNF